MREHLEGVRLLGRQPPGQLRLDVEAISVMRQAVVVDQAAAARPYPLAVQSVELVRVDDALGRAEMDGRVADLDASGVGLKASRLTKVECLPIGRNVNQLHNRRKHWLLMRPGIEYSDASRRREPESAVDGAISAAADRVAGRALRASESILQAVVDGLQARTAARCKIVKLPPGDAADAAGR